MVASESKAVKSGPGASGSSGASRGSGAARGSGTSGGSGGSAPLPGSPVRGSRTGRPVMALLDLLGRRWALRVLWELRDGDAPTFRELQSRCGGISSSVLSERLRELRAARIVSAPERSGGYQLTPDGHELLAVLAPVDEWARRRLTGSGG
jgi:DNA-binding HxlR family transcriptional regulator